MPYYDQFTKQKSKRDDWRDDERTHRPARDAHAGLPETRSRRDDSRPSANHHSPDMPPRPPMTPPPHQPGRPVSPPPPKPGHPVPPPPKPGHPVPPPPPRGKSFGPNTPPRPGHPVPPPPPRPGHPVPPPPPRPGHPVPPPPPPRPGHPVPPPPPPGRPPHMMQEPENLLIGRNPIREALRAGRDIEKLLVARGDLTGSAREIVAMARERRVIVQEVDRVRLDAMSPGHQGLIAVVSAYAYSTVDAMFALARQRHEPPFLVILDGVTDPHNLGAIIRSAECAGAHGVIIPERRAVGLTPAAVKASAGAVEHIPVAREVNLTRTVERLKREGVWVYGAAMQGEDYRRVNFSGPAALVIGSEGDGLSRLVTEHCDKLVSVPMCGHINSLNASVAAGVLLFAIMNARR